MKRILCLSLLILLTSVAAFSDIAPERTPKPTPTPKTTPVSVLMSIKMDSNTKVATLSIPREQLKQLRAEIDQLDNEKDNTAITGISRTQTIVSGAFLSLALVFGGMWFVRSGKSATKTGKTLVILAMIGVIGSAATFVYANAGPPSELRSISSTLFDKKAFGYWNSAMGKVNLEVWDAQVIELKVPAPKKWPNDKENKEDE